MTDSPAEEDKSPWIQWFVGENFSLEVFVESESHKTLKVGNLCERTGGNRRGWGVIVVFAALDYPLCSEKIIEPHRGKSDAIGDLAQRSLSMMPRNNVTEQSLISTTYFFVDWSIAYSSHFFIPSRYQHERSVDH